MAAIMKTSLSVIVIFLTLSCSFCVPSSVSGQQENDDPNWRERRVEELIKRFENLNKEVEKREEMLRRSLERRNPTPKSRFFDIYDYGPLEQGSFLRGAVSSRL